MLQGSSEDEVVQVKMPGRRSCQAHFSQCGKTWLGLAFPAYHGAQYTTLLKELQQ